MKRIVILLFILAGVFHFKNDIGHFFKSGLFDENGNPRIVLFIQNDCGKPCNMAREDLNARGIEYEELDIHLNKQLVKEVGFPRTLPYLIVGKEKVQGYNQGKYSSNLAQYFGDLALTSYEESIYQKHFDNNGDPIIVLYGTAWCGYCKKLRKAFNEHNMPFLDYDVEKPVKQVELIKTLGITGYPTVYVGYERVQGFDIKAVQAAL